MVRLHAIGLSSLVHLLFPQCQQTHAVLIQNLLDPAQLVIRIASVLEQFDGCQPKFRLLALSAYMHMRALSQIVLIKTDFVGADFDAGH